MTQRLRHPQFEPAGYRRTRKRGLWRNREPGWAPYSNTESQSNGRDSDWGAKAGPLEAARSRESLQGLPAATGLEFGPPEIGDQWARFEGPSAPEWSEASSVSDRNT
jgi:hypothetical protein